MGSVTLTETRSGSVTGTLAIDGSSFTPGNWLFAVYDRLSDVMLSCEYGGAIYMGRLDIASELGRTGDITDVEWTEIETDPGISISDHWHIYAHGRHWLSFQDTTSLSEAIWVFVINRRLRTATAPGEVQVLSATAGGPGLVALGADHALNDHFIVVAPDGVYLAVWNETTFELTIVNVDGTLSTATEIGPYVFTDPGWEGVGPGGSAWRGVDATAGLQYHVVTPTTLADATESSIYYGIADSSWTEPGSPDPIISEYDKSLIMPTIMKFPNGWTLITYIRRSITDNQPGDVVRQLYDENMDPQGDVEMIHEGPDEESAGRPHVTLLGSYLITCWDLWDYSVGTDGASAGCYLRIDEVTLS